MTHLKLNSKLDYLLADFSNPYCSLPEAKFELATTSEFPFERKRTHLLTFCNQRYTIVSDTNGVFEVSTPLMSATIRVNLKAGSWRVPFAADHPYSRKPLKDQFDPKHRYAEIYVDKVVDESCFKFYPREVVIDMQQLSPRILEDTIQFYLDMGIHRATNSNTVKQFDWSERKEHLLTFCKRYEHLHCTTFWDKNAFAIAKEDPTDSLQVDRVTINFSPVEWYAGNTWENTYAFVKVNSLIDESRIDIHDREQYISLTPASQIVLEEWLDNVFKLLSPTDSAKRKAGYMAVDKYVRSNTVVGLGTGSTAFHAVRRVALNLFHTNKLQNIVCIPTSEETKTQATTLCIPLITLDDCSQIDVAIDGADAVDQHLNLVKGGGGALLREKMVELASGNFVCIVDDSKLCSQLGKTFPLPVEIVKFCHKHTTSQLVKLLGCRASFRMASINITRQASGHPAKTDNNNYIVDLFFDQGITDVKKTAKILKHTVGVVEHGLFCGMARTVIVAGKDGTCKIAGEGGQPIWW